MMDPSFIEGGLWDEEIYRICMKRLIHHGITRICSNMQWNWYYNFFFTLDSTAIDLPEELNTPAYKIASEIVDINLIKKLLVRKPIIFSTGMASKEEIKDAIEVILSQNNKK